MEKRQTRCYSESLLSVVMRHANNDVGCVTAVMMWGFLVGSTISWTSYDASATAHIISDMKVDVCAASLMVRYK